MSAAVDELALHKQAYVRIFQAVLGKLPGDPSAKNQKLSQLKDFNEKNVRTVDDFLNHIPTYAKILGVSEAQLGSFVGANFLKALEMTEKLEKEKKAQSTGGSNATSTSTTGRDSGVDPNTEQPVLREILQKFGTIVQPPDRFLPDRDGFMKFLSMDKEVLSKNLANLDSSGTTDRNGSGSAGGPSQASSGSPTSPSSPSIGGVGAESAQSQLDQAGQSSQSGESSQAVQKAAYIQPEEKPILQEILQKFGNVLDIPGKLVPSTGLEGMAPSDDDDDDEDGDEDGIDKDQSSANGSDSQTMPSSTAQHSQGGKSATPGSPTAATASQPEEKPILQEILQKFGNVLDIPGKLVPSTGLEGMTATGPDDEDVSTKDDSDSHPEDQESINPIELSFTDYLDVAKRIQDFRQSGDNTAYKTWLNSSRSGKAVVGIRNLETKAQQGGAMDWHKEYEILAPHLATDWIAIRDAHEHVKRYQVMQTLLSNFSAQMKSWPAPLSEAVRRVWPQFRSLMNMVEREGHVNSQLKIVLLQIPDAGMRQKVQELLEGLLNKMEACWG